MNVQSLVWGVAGLAGCGAWLLLRSLGEATVTLVQRIGRYRQGQAQRQLAQYQTAATDALPDAVLYGYPNVAWSTLGWSLAGGGFLALLPVVGLPGALAAVILERVPYLVRGLLKREGETRLRLALRDFVDDLREAIAIHGSLGKALDVLVVTHSTRHRALALALARRTRTRGAQVSADQVLAQMATDLRSPEMADVAAQVRLALAGGMNLAEALDTVADTLTELIAAAVNVRLQAAPNTYIMPMVVFIFGPLLILMLYPVALRVAALIAGGM